VRVQASRLNGCTFCQDLALARAVRERVGAERFAALEEFRTSDRFTERERTALAVVEEATLHRRLSEGTAARLREHFTETEIVELVWANAAENYFNLQAAVLGIESDGLAALATAGDRGQGTGDSQPGEPRRAVRGGGLPAVAAPGFIRG
jgi:alkylhydroperoxidase family enzyme